MAFKPTKQQDVAIKRNGNILVSAAAGSGKTAVLVERVIRLLTDKNSKVKADELLIVTFTNTAAAEMRARIEKRINEVCLENPNNPSLLEQKHLLANAKICTIDSFCIDLVRENFDKLGISPDFKISDNVSLKAIDEQIIYSIIGRYISEGNDTISELADLVGGEYDEANLAETVLDIYETSRQLPYPQVWFDKLLSGYNNGVFDSSCIWYGYTLNMASQLVRSMQEMLVNIADLLSFNHRLANHYTDAIDKTALQLSELEDAVKTNDWDTVYNFLKTFNFLGLPDAIKGTAKTPEVLALKEVFEFYDKDLAKLKKFFYGDYDYISKQFSRMQKPLELLVQILKEFESKVFEEYKRQNTYTFHNIEHLALNLLCKFDDEGNIIPNDYAKELCDQFAEVMVDEYQDTNDLQDSFFYALSNRGEKLFIVGDVKQSIYGFRGANPNNFLNKKNTYIAIENAQENDPQKIILAQNFRTKNTVCEFINYFFEMFMTNQTGDLVYDGEERLDPQAKYPSISGNSVEYALINCKSANEKRWVLEARYIAEYIRKIMASGDIIKNDKDGTLRKAEYKDFTILMRSLTNANLIINELTSQGIPVDISLDAFAENREISTMLSLLKVVDNPNLDVELLTVLVSPIFAFTTDELALIRTGKRDGTLYSAIINAANNGNLKAIDFLERIDRYRTFAVSMNLPDLISTLLIETEFLNIITAYPNGEKRKNNLLMLVEYAIQFVNSNSNSLKRFVDYVLNLSKAGLKAAIGSSSNNAVKIMTIHGSKGLQFPVCIIAGTASPFNDSESKDHINYSIENGIGFKYYDETEQLPLTTLSREVIIDNIYAKSLEEELRLLYVAMTRTKDKMLIISAFENLDSALQKCKSRLAIYDSKISTSFFLRTRSYADWLLPAVLLHKDGNQLRNSDDLLLISDNTSNIDVNVIDGEELLSKAVTVEENFAVADKDLADKIRTNAEYEYPFIDVLKIRSKTSVSALANKAESDKYAFDAKPSFMNKSGMSATDRGTAMHRVMQYFDFDKADDIDGEIERLYEWQFINESEYKTVDRNALKQFFKSDIFKRIKNADLVKREMRFLTEVSATMIDQTLDSRFSDEQVIIQGAVDVCFIEKGELVILDFKTDRVDDTSALSDTYGMQLSIYALACEKIFNLPIKEKVIYSFNLGETINV